MTDSGKLGIDRFSKNLKKNTIQLNTKVFLDRSQDGDAHGTLYCLVL